MHTLEAGSAGRQAFETRNVPAWRLLGQDAPQGASTHEMLRKSGLAGWNVRLEPLEHFAGRALDGSPVTIPVPSQHVVLRDNPNTDAVEALSVVGSRYHVVQNETVFGWADNILDGGGKWESAGQFRDGRFVYGSLVIDRDVVLDPGGIADKVKTYLLVYGSHDGSTPTVGVVSPMRLFCQNQLPALRKAKSRFAIRHTASFEERLQQAREALNITFVYMDAFEAEAQRLYQTGVTNQEFTRLVTTLYPKPDEEKKGALTRWENKVDLLQSIYHGNADTIVDGAPNTTNGTTGTAWGALNAVTEYLDWYRTARGGDGSSLAEAASGFVPAVQTEKARVYGAVLELTK